MSDLFASELLILLLLFPVILRPFVKEFRSIEGFAVVPSIACGLLIFVYFAHGFVLNLLPITLFTLLMFFIHLPRLIRFLTKLATDYFDPASYLFSVIASLLFLIVLIFTINTRPEPLYHSKQTIKIQSETKILANGLGVSVVSWTPKTVDSESIKGIVLLSRDIGISLKSRPTLASVLAENNYIVLEANLFGNNGLTTFMSSTQTGRSILFVIQELIPKFKRIGYIENTEKFHQREFEYLVSYAKNAFNAHEKIFLCAEGSSIKAFTINQHKNLELLSGAILLKDSNTDISFLEKRLTIEVSVQEILPKTAALAQQFVVSAPKEFLFGYGELGANDVLFANLLGCSRDEGRKKAEITARKILSWLDMKTQEI